MTQQVRHALSDDTPAQWLFSLTSVAVSTAAVDSEYAYRSDNDGAHQLNITLFDIVASSVNYLEYNGEFRVNSGSAIFIAPRIIIDTTIYSGTSVNVTSTTNVTVSYQWFTNPATGSAFTQNEINGVGANSLKKFALRNTSTGAGETVYCDEVKLICDYVESGVSLIINNSDYSLAFGNIDLTQASILIIDNQGFGISFEAVDLTQANILSIDSSQYNFTIENLDLIQQGVLNINNNTYITTSTHIDLTFDLVLIVDNTNINLVSDNLNLSVVNILNISNLNYDFQMDVIDLIQQNLLVIQNALYGIQSPELVMIVGELIPHSDRVVRVLSDDRVINLKSEDRILNIPREIRIVKISKKLN